MIATIKNNITAIQQICKDLAVSQLYVFGSAARVQNFNDASDIDFLFRFESFVENLEVDIKPDYLELLFRLENLLKRKVDLVWLDGINNPYFIQSIQKDILPIYGA